MTDLTKAIEMHVVRGVEVTGEVVLVRDYRVPATLSDNEKTAQFVGILLSSGSVIHIPTDRGQKMLELAEAMLKTWKNPELDYSKTNTAVKALFFEADVAVMITKVKRGPHTGKPQYRFYDALAKDTFLPSPTTGQPRVKVVHEKGDPTNGYMTI